MVKAHNAEKQQNAEQQMVRNNKQEIASEFATDVKEVNQIAKKREKQGRERRDEPKDAKSKNVKGPR
ncbi:hypothetical protein [Calidifontibacillus erzurumensis]|uniref:Uncharacterized protein n=1 Tax=Calidifontibacillus erzurumensis TaxID=2741433 RepID=A0A8J8GEX8_9BACI|nr:hypothetical protein [Calidifontibacillus erzurumensis]NSL52244.1 hypothetical protein [Calidifontibacillus erzurumensis]